ncbi:hypothetical protein H6P81_013549 [Aristolochia fimbriata]|uniref:Uncharacterized protein n=1 Tax=Aristolochia fimbriata TaxID=158543 RepID=A0AAV7EI84_ARIFI|nr:hypothetical protein H6P81_013549 [Aristolochia fimbriata]
MGRKSSSRNNDGGGGGGGGGGAATVMGLRMIQCGRQTVHVIQPDGQVRQFVVPVRVSDLLQLYPHNFVTHAAPGTTATGGGVNPLLEGGAVTAGAVKRTSGILPHDAYLETGSIYVLLPLPRLFPSSPPATPHFCSCFFAAAGRAEEGLGIGGAIKAELKRHLPSVVGGGGGGGATSSSSKISPEDNGGAFGSFSTSSSSSSSIPLPRRLWEPPLEIISEDKVLVINPIPSPTTTTSSSTTYAKHDDETATEKKENQNKGKKLVTAALNNLKLRLEEKKTSTHQAASEKSKNPVLVSSKTEEGRS